MRRMRIGILTTSCQRCGRPIATASRSIIGADAAKAQFDRICSRCITPEEEKEIRRIQAKAIMNRCRAGGGR